MKIYESHNGTHWTETRLHRPVFALYGGDAFWFVLGHIILLPLALSVLALTALCLPLYWLWAHLRTPRPKATHGEVLRLQSQFQINPAMTCATDDDAHPDISVVVPFHNRADWVDRVISSLLSQHLPEGKTAEIIAVDNHSIDRTMDLLRSYPVRVIQCAQPGPAAARNAGLNAARAPIVAFTDSDCLTDTHWLANLTHAFDRPDMLITGGRIISYDQDDFVATFTDNAKILNNERFFEGSGYFPPFFATANAAYRRDALRQAGGFDCSLWMSEDADLACRVMDLGGRMAYLHEAAVYHQHRDTLGGLWKQAMDYGAASVGMFANNRHRLKAAIGISWKNIRDIAWSPVAITYHLILGLVHKPGSEHNRSFYRVQEIIYALWRLGFTIGCIRECIRKKVFFV